MSNPQHPVPGDKIIDASDIEMYDLTPEQILRKTKLREGFDGAAKCVLRLTSDQIKLVGISPEMVNQTGVLLAQHSRAHEVLPAAEKLVELLKETKIETGHQLGIALGDIAAQARRRAERDPRAAEVLGALQELLDYVSAPAVKAAATRSKAAAEENQDPPA